MSFESLDRILHTVEQQSGWHEQPLPRVLKCWRSVVGEVVANHTRPTSIQRDVLWVATSSAAWAQTLTFERQRILDKLKVYLSSPLVDIRFSTAAWQQPEAPSSNSIKIDCESHPSNTLVVRSDSVPKIEQAPTPQAAFQHWAENIQARTVGLPLCPQCQCPTPVGELQRWSICAICAAKKW